MHLGVFEKSLSVWKEIGEATCGKGAADKWRGKKKEVAVSSS